MRYQIFGSVMVLALAACSSPEEVKGRMAVESDETASATAPTDPETPDKPDAPAESAEAVKFEDNDKDGEAERDFSYSWPKQVSAIPALAKTLSEERDKALAEQKKEWKESVDEFGSEGCVTCVMRDYSKTWAVVTDTPRFLSISSESYFYTGGAHGNTATGGMVWDRKAGASMDARQMFSSEGAFWGAAQAAYCSALNDERAERRGRPVQSDDYGSECPKLEELTLLAGSSNGKTFDRLGLIADPYVAGAYAEGPYEVTLPVTDAILAAVKGEYREYFSVK